MTKRGKQRSFLPHSCLGPLYLILEESFLYSPYNVPLPHRQRRNPMFMFSQGSLWTLPFGAACTWIICSSPPHFASSLWKCSQDRSRPHRGRENSSCPVWIWVVGSIKEIRNRKPTLTTWFWTNFARIRVSVWFLSDFSMYFSSGSAFRKKGWLLCTLTFFPKGFQLRLGMVFGMRMLFGIV